MAYKHQTEDILATQTWQGQQYYQRIGKRKWKAVSCQFVRTSVKTALWKKETK